MVADELSPEEDQAKCGIGCRLHGLQLPGARGGLRLQRAMISHRSTVAELLSFYLEPPLRGKSDRVHGPALHSGKLGWRA